MVMSLLASALTAQGLSGLASLQAPVPLDLACCGSLSGCTMRWESLAVCRLYSDLHGLRIHPQATGSGRFQTKWWQRCSGSHRAA